MAYIEIKNATKKIKEQLVLNHITLELEKGKVYGLYGKNGSGKTMLMRAVCGLIRLNEGEIIVGGDIIGRDISFPKSIGVLLENPSFIGNYSGKKNLEYLAEIQKKITVEDISEVMRRVGLDPENKKQYKKYSLGMKQRLGIAAAIMEKPEVIILDEPTNALDSDGITLINHIIQEEKKRNALIIVSCHDKEELDYLADEIIQIKDGKAYGIEKKTERGDEV